jgi:YD repeat-containing protein
LGLLIQKSTCISQTRDRENYLVKVVTGSQTTRFRYDGSGRRTTTLNPDGTITYNPFPTYQETRNGSSTTNTRATYMLAGQAMAVRTNGTFYYLLNDHLGSASMTVTRDNGGISQRQRFLPFGRTHTAAGSDLAGRGYTAPSGNRFCHLQVNFSVPQGLLAGGLLSFRVVRQD